jgi:hypothetical protein
MASFQQIEFSNLTGSAITLASLQSIVVPASGTIDVTNLLFSREIIESAELLAAVNNDEILLIIDSVTLTKAQSIDLLNDSLQDLLSFSYVPTNYTRDDSGADSISTSSIGAHLLGLDERIRQVAGENAVIFPFTQETSSGTVSAALTLTTKSSLGWQTVSIIPFRGTNNATPTLFTVSSQYNNGQAATGSYSIRLVDIDNASAVILSASGLTNLAFADQSFSSFANLSATKVDWELQVQQEGVNQNRDINLAWFSLEYGG